MIVNNDTNKYLSFAKNDKIFFLINFGLVFHINKVKIFNKKPLGGDENE